MNQSMTDSTSNLQEQAAFPQEQTSLPRRIPIPRIKGFDQESFERDYRDQRPVIITDAISSWPAASWTPEFFEEKWGDLEVRAYVSYPDGLPYESAASDHREKVTVQEFFELAKSDAPCYINQSKIGLYEGLGQDEGEYDFAPFVAGSAQQVHLWMGSKTRSGFHYDGANNFLAQVYGTKKVYLASPEHSRNNYPYRDNIIKSRIDPSNPDLETYPGFKKVTILESVLEPGDVLYLPRGWWHHLVAPSFSITLNCWHGESYGVGYSAMLALRLGPLTILRIVRDFFWLGILGQKYKRRFGSPAPTGRALYEKLVGG